MTVFRVPATGGTIRGTAGDDVYLIDPAAVGDVVVRDLGGLDRIVVTGPGFEPELEALSRVGGALVLETVASGSVRFLLGKEGAGDIEGFERNADFDPDGPSRAVPIVLPGQTAPAGRALFAGTDGGDRILIPARNAVEFSTTTAYGGAGADAIVTSRSRGYQAEIFGGRGDDRLMSRGDAAGLFGGAGDDVLRDDGFRDVLGGPISRLLGEDGDDRLFGGVGGGALVGGAGQDLLVSGGGRTLLVGGTHDDRLIGGSGEDQFVFGPGAGRGEGRDVIEGWDRSDLIKLSDVEPGEATLTLQGEDTVIAYLDAGRITVLGAHLTMDDLVFA